MMDNSENQRNLERASQSYATALEGSSAAVSIQAGIPGVWHIRAFSVGGEVGENLQADPRLQTMSVSAGNDPLGASLSEPSVSGIDFTLAEGVGNVGPLESSVTASTRRGEGVSTDVATSVTVEKSWTLLFINGGFDLESVSEAVGDMLRPVNDFAQANLDAALVGSPFGEPHSTLEDK